MQKFILRPSSKNQVMIPKPVRQALGVDPKEPIAVIIDDEGKVTLEPARLLSISELKGILPPLGRATSPGFSVEIRAAMRGQRLGVGDIRRKARFDPSHEPVASCITATTTPHTVSSRRAVPA